MIKLLITLLGHALVITLLFKMLRKKPKCKEHLSYITTSREILYQVICSEA